MRDIPNGWVTTDFGSLLTQILGGGTPSKSVSAYFEGDVPFMTVKDMTERFTKDTVDHISEEAIQSSATTVVPADTLIVATRMSLGKVVRPKFTTAINQDLKAIFLADGVDKTFIEHWWRYRSNFIQDLGTGTTVKGIRLEVIRSLSINLAPLNEQKRIADKLDTLLARVDVCRERLDRVPTILKRFRQAVLAAATTGALTEEWRESKSIENDWVDVELGNVAESFSYGSAAKSAREGKIPVLRMGNIQNGQLEWDDLVFTSDPREIKKYRLQTGDVLFNRTNSPELVGKTAVFKGERDAIYAGYLIRVRCGSRLLPDYLNYCLNSPAGRNYCWQVKSDGVSQSNINAKKLAAFRFCLPPIAEQHEIVRRVETLFASAGRLEARYATGRTHVDRLIPALLDKAFRGELVPQDPNDETAEKLLECILAAKANETVMPKRKAPGRKPIMTKITTETVKAAISQLPNDAFSFDELRSSFPGDYESIKDAVFALLGETTPTLQQFFDPEVQSIRFKRV